MGSEDEEVHFNSFNAVDTKVGVMKPLQWKPLCIPTEATLVSLQALQMDSEKC